MEDIQRQINELSASLAQERNLREQAEARAQNSEARLAAMEADRNGAANPQPAPSTHPDPVTPAAVPTTSPKGPKVSVPDKFNGSRGGPAEIYASQVQLYMLAHPNLFRDDHSKVVFALSYLTGAASSWAQPLMQELLDESTSHLVTFQRFVTNFKAMYFDTEKKAKAERALRTLTQKSTVAAYAHEFNIHSTATEWETPTLISHFEQGLKKEIRVTMVMHSSEFSSIEEIANLAIRIDSKLHGASDTTTTFHVPTAADPNAMDISSGFVRLSSEERARRLRTGSCFKCGVQGHIASGCPSGNGGNKKFENKRSGFHGFKNKVAESEAKIDALSGGGTVNHVDKGEGGSRSDMSKNGGAQE